MAGLERWRRNLYVCWTTQIFSLAGFGFMVPFLPFYLQELGLTDPAKLRLWVGLFSSIPSLVMAILAPVWGILADRYGRKLMIVRAMLGGGLAVGFMAMIHSVGAAFALRVMVGVFGGSVPASATLVAAGTPNEKLSSSLGFLSSSTFIGLSIGPLIGGMSAEILGYRPTFYIGSLIMIVGAVLVMLFVEDVKTEERLERRQVRSWRRLLRFGRSAAPAGSAWAGTAAAAAAEELARAGPQSRDEPSVEPEAAQGSQRQFHWKQLLTPTYVSLFSILFLIRFCQMLPQPLVPLYVEQLLGGPGRAASTTGMISSAGAVMTALAGLTLVRLGDRHNRYALLALFFAAAALLALPLYFPLGILGFAILRVAGIYFVGAIEPTMQSQLGAISPADRRGLVFGVHTTVASFAWFVSPLVASAISISWGLRTVFLTFSIGLGLSALFVTGYMLRVRRGRVRMESNIR